jgi:hypothetical protein
VKRAVSQIPVYPHGHAKIVLKQKQNVFLKLMLPNPVVQGSVNHHSSGLNALADS